MPVTHALTSRARFTLMERNLAMDAIYYNHELKKGTRSHLESAALLEYRVRVLLLYLASIGARHSLPATG